MRKSLIYAASLLLCPLASFSQQNELQQNGYVYANFVDGRVLLKNGSVEEVALNYNSNNQDIAFMKDGQQMMLTNFDDIDTIYLDGKKFVPVEEKFYYVSSANKFPLLVSYVNKPHSQTTTTDHNGTGTQSTNTVSNTISDQYTNRRFQGKHFIELSKNFWVSRSHSLDKANTEKQFVKIFPEKEDEIKTYVSANSIDFSKEEDMMKLVDYVSTIIKK